MTQTNTFLKLLGTAAIALTLSACGNASTGKVDSGNSSAAAEVAVSNAQIVSQGEFLGRSDHITTGQVSLEKTAAGYQLSFASDFSLDGAPDPIVAVGNGETYLPSNKIGALKNKEGRQVYQLPVGFTPAQFSQVYVWCEEFSVPLGVANLTQN